LRVNADLIEVAVKSTATFHRTVLLIGIAAHWNAPIRGQLPAGYYLGATAWLPDSLREEHWGGRYSIILDRNVGTEAERAMIEIAERLFPDSNTILAEAAKVPAQRVYVVERLNSARLIPGDRWWWDGDRLRTPYATTATAVAHYLVMARQYAEREQPTARKPRPPNLPSDVAYPNPPTLRLRYSASLRSAASDAPDGTYWTVELELSWDYECGILCAHGFGSTRKVHFDDQRRPLAVEGDGIPMVIAS
jgi:hypothetical protein